MKPESVTSLVAEIEAAWNSHDMSRFAACFSPDGDFVNVGGMWWRGRKEIEENHAASHATRFKDSTIQLELAALKEIAPGVGVAHIRWQLDGHDASGPSRTTETRRGIWSWTVRERGGELEIVSAHNTDQVTRAPAT